MTKIKLFLGAYINSQNAQNINCLALAEYLDAKKFDIYTMSRKDGTIDINHLQNKCTVLSYNTTFKFTKMWPYLYALYKCDVLYLAKQQKLSLIALLNKLFFHKKLFFTMEMVINRGIIEKKVKNNKEGLKQYLKKINSINTKYAISPFIKEYNEKHLGIICEDTILYLGVNTDFFKQKQNMPQKLDNVIFIGNDMIRKGIHEYIALASGFPDITFHVVGRTYQLDFTEIQAKHSNLVIHGSLTPSELNTLLQKIDLHVLPSKAEGFPKVILETAAVGIPSIVYDTYGADNWMQANKNGFIVHTYEEIQQLFHMLVQKPTMLHDVSLNTPALSQKFLWKNMIVIWEKELLDLANKDR